MLELTVIDGDTEVVLSFEHSLLSLSKWESKYKIAFSTSRQKPHSEMLDYYQFMLTVPGVDPNLVYRLSPEQMDNLTNYINESRTASSVPKDTSPAKGSTETVTSELIYYWMMGLKIPFNPAETWHLSRLMMLIQIASFKQQPEDKKKRPLGKIMSEWRVENDRRKAEYNTSG